MPKFLRYFSHSEFIARPQAVVFEFLTDFSQAPRWRSMVRSVTPLNNEPIQAGTRLNITVNMGGEEVTRTITMLVFEPPSRWRHLTDEEDFHGEIEYVLTPEHGGTRITMTGDVRPRNVLGWLAMPLVLMRRGQPYRDQLPQLKRVLESA